MVLFPTVKDNLNVTGTVDGVDLEVFDNTVVTLDGNQEITGKNPHKYLLSNAKK